jgi:TRAP-type C4-dicarboxylate transport system substrate-binding protein
MAELQGKKINVMTGYQRKVFNEVGWIPVNMQVPELYESLSRGVIEGIFLTAAAVVPMKFYEIGKAQVIFGPNSMNNAPLAFNLDSWNHLPKDVQEAFMEAAWETAQWSVQGTDNFIKATYERLEQTGARLVRISKEENDMFFNVVTKITRCLAILGAVSIAVLMVVNFTDIIGTKFFLRSVPGALDISEELMVLLTLLPIVA